MILNVIFKRAEFEARKSPGGAVDCELGSRWTRAYASVPHGYATLDALCGGRLVFGVGLGYREVEYAAFGVDPSEKVRRFVANLDIIRRLWSGESVDADLPWCQLSEAKLTMLPIQRPGPAIWMAAHSDAAFRRAARMADA